MRPSVTAMPHTVVAGQLQWAPVRLCAVSDSVPLNGAQSIVLPGVVPLSPCCGEPRPHCLALAVAAFAPRPAQCSMPSQRQVQSMPPASHPEPAGDPRGRAAGGELASRKSSPSFTDQEPVIVDRVTVLKHLASLSMESTALLSCMYFYDY
jgi:hypothetical protein